MEHYQLVLIISSYFHFRGDLQMSPFQVVEVPTILPNSVVDLEV